MSAWDWLVGAFLVGGCLMSLGAAIGIVRFPDVLARMHAGAKPQVFGLLLILAGIGCAARDWRMVPLLVLIWLLQLLAVPVASHMVARSGFRNKHFRPESLSHNELEELVARMNRESGPGPGQASEEAMGEEPAHGEQGENR